MRRSEEEVAPIERFDRPYQPGQTDTMRAIECAICGCDYGGMGWTMRQEPEGVSGLLDVGAGSGWPALYIAGTSGCGVTLVDLPLRGIRTASKRSKTERPAGSCGFVVGDGSALPFQAESFDAISHSEVLCCLSAKEAVPAECRRVLRRGARMAFSVTHSADGVSSAKAAAAVALAPPYIEAECRYPEMLPLEKITPASRCQVICSCLVR